jgi:hypothetical protein
MKNSKKYILSTLAILLLACTHSVKDSKENWLTLFNGEDLKDWIVKVNHHEPGVNFGNTFRAEDGMIKVRYDQYGDFNDQFSHLFYKVPFSHFHLKFEYRFTLVSYSEELRNILLLNSGVMFHAQGPYSRYFKRTELANLRLRCNY